MPFIRQLYKWNSFPALCLVVILAALGGTITPTFFSSAFFTGFFGSFVPLIIVSMGQAIVLIGGGLDISVGATLSLVNVAIVHFIGLGMALPEATALGLLMGLGIGLLNGVVISYFRVSPLIVTFGTSSIASGIALSIQPYPGGQAPMSFILWYQQTTLGIPNPILFVIVSYLIWLVLRFTPFGIQIYAFGKELRKAYGSGIPVSRLRLATYLLSSLTAGIAAIAMTASIGSGDPLVGATLTLNSLAACVIGGISLMGGVGRVSGAILGAVFLSLVFTTVLAAQFSPYYQNLLSGVIVLVSIMAASLAKVRQKSV